MFKRIALHVLMITSIGILAACAAPSVPVATNSPTVAPISTPPVAVSSTGVPTAEPTATAVPPEKFQSVSIVKIPAPSLANNLVGEPAERKILIYLPPSYGTPNKRFPTVYYLPGYGDSGMIGFYLPANLDALIKNGKAKDVIVVVADGVSKMGGSFYVNSPVTGNWEDFIAQDVVDYVDSHFRTLTQPESRGIAGHSMGGFGALNLAMHRPDVFGAVYSMSPGLFDENGLRESQMFSNDDLIEGFIEYENELASLPADEAQQRMFTAPQPFALSYGYAFAPNPDRQPPYYDYPFKEVNGRLVGDDGVWKKWESGYGGIADEAKQYKDNFLKLKGIVVDYGESDEYAWIPKGCVYFGEQLTAAGIPVKVEAYTGTHESALGDRIRDHMFPFFAATLKSEEPTVAPPAPVAPALNSQPPASCVVTGQQTYVNAFDGYCFAYPARFELETAPTGQPQLFGPALDQNLDALRASLALEVEVAVKDGRLSEIVDRYVKQFEGMKVPAITRTLIELGGEPAEMLEVVPGREGSRDVFMLHEGTLYHFMFMPSVRDFPQAKSDVEELYSAVTQSFSFTSKKPRPLEVSASPRDPGVSGVVRWGTQPVPNAIVELRTGDWRVNPNAAMQSATTDPEGRYFMPIAPAGDFVMCGLFPEGAQERSTCTPVHIEAGQDTPGIDVMLLRAVSPVAPSMDAQVVALPTLSWQSFPNAAKYEVFVIDAGTTELLQHEFVTDTEFTVSKALQPGRTYDWVVNAVAADGGLLADGESRFVVQP